jgi:hypothetical protein
MLDVSGPSVRQYCSRHGYQYETFIGISRGFAPRHAAFNRIYLLLDAVKSKRHDWALYLDVDCYIIDHKIKLESFISENKEKAFVFCRGKRDQTLFDFNNGSFFINLRHPCALEVLIEWQNAFESIWTEEKLSVWTEWSASALGAPGDQRLLQEIVRARLERGEDVASWLKVYDGDEWQRFNYSGPFVRQCLRSTGLDVTGRVLRIKSDLARAGIQS